MIDLTRRLLWGAWKGDQFARTFRVDIDQSSLDLEDEEVYVAKEYAWRREALAVEEALGALGDITPSEITQELLRVLC